jgi:hypothetical protein
MTNDRLDALRLPGAGRLRRDLEIALGKRSVIKLR